MSKDFNNMILTVGRLIELLEELAIDKNMPVEIEVWTKDNNSSDCVGIVGAALGVTEYLCGINGEEGKRKLNISATTPEYYKEYKEEFDWPITEQEL